MMRFQTKAVAVREIKEVGFKGLNVTKIVTDDAGEKAALGVRSLMWYKEIPGGWKAKSWVK